MPANSDDDDIPTLGSSDNDDDIPILSGDGDVPELSPDDKPVQIPEADPVTDKDSMKAAIAELESMELGLKAPERKDLLEESPEEHQPELNLDPGDSLMKKIQENADEPAFREDAAMIRENPFLSSNTRAKLEKSKKLQEESMAKTRTSITSEEDAGISTIENSQPMTEVDNPADSLIDFNSDNPFTNNAATEPNSNNTESGVEKEALSPEEAFEKTMAEAESLLNEELVEDAADEILSLIGEEETEPPEATPEKPPQADQPVHSKSLSDQKLSEDEINTLIDEVYEEYRIVLEAVIKEKLRDRFS